MFTTTTANIAAQRQGGLFDDPAAPADFELTASPGTGLVWDDNGKPVTMDAALARLTLKQRLLMTGPESAVRAFSEELQRHITAAAERAAS